MKPPQRLEVPRSPRLIAALQAGIAHLAPGAVIETGTYKGTGSTRAILDAFAGRPLPPFHTIEIAAELIAVARTNLADHPEIDFVHGLTAGRAEAVAFIHADRFIHDLDPDLDIAVDFLPDPPAGYLAELGGSMGQNAGPAAAAAPAATAPEDVLRPLLRRHRDDRPLICLDSAGGLGWLEFQIVLEAMGTRPYLLFLDDINHVKHYRSYRHIQASMEFLELDADFDEGWLVARHFGPPR